MKNKEIIINGSGFTIRPYRKSDFISLVENANNEKIARDFITVSINRYNKKEAEKFIAQSIAKNDSENSTGNFVIEINSLAVGVISGNIKKDKPFTFIFGYWLGEKYWNRGIISKVVKLYTKYLFNKLKNLQRIEATVFLWNEASKKVLENNNFKLEGILRKNHQYRGKIIDEYIFSKLRNER